MVRFLCCYILLSTLLSFNMASSPNASGESDSGLLLYLHNYSFYAQKVMMALHEKKLAFKEHVVDILKDENYKPWFLDINPRGEIPVLKDGMKIIPDSARIIDYLEDNFSNGDHPRLIPQEPALKQKVNNFREKINSINGNTVTFGTLYHPELCKNQKMPFIAPVRSHMKASYEKTGEKLRKFAEENPNSRDILNGKAEQFEKTKFIVTNTEAYLQLLDKVDKTLSEIEEELKSHEDKSSWLVSKDFSVADVDLTTLLGRLELVGLSHRFWEAGVRPEVTDYFQRVQQRDSYKNTVPGTMFHIKTLVGYKVLAGVGSAIAGLGGGLLFWRRGRSGGDTSSST